MPKHTRNPLWANHEVLFVCRSGDPHFNVDCKVLAIVFDQANDEFRYKVLLDKKDADGIGIQQWYSENELCDPIPF